ncbi:MAG TPA: OB-fold nucleic acid binding domain-containing protein, partial [Wenzhouxiangella sp.]
LQYIYRKYGRERAALAATVTSYRPKSALKDVGRALGFEQETLNALTRSLAWWDTPDQWPERLQAAGVDPGDLRAKWLLQLTQQFIGLPRHLSQHVGGMVISDQPLYELVPIENAAMADRTIIQWDKDDLETLGLLKVDCLALGMLTVLRKAMHSIDPSMRLADIPKEDPATYEMLCKADAVGVFQVESRAQMAMLPRLKPRCFYDLVVEIALVRPGPIQGEMVHPYLQRRQNPTQVDYPDPKLAEVLKRTLGVPIFQEQVMQIAMVAADFTPGQADQLRRAMAAWKRRGGLAPFRESLITGMLNNGYSKAFAEKIYGQIQGFGDYGFPESHAASFALLTYFSAWLKCHHPAAFTCALLNSQPMGFYAPAQLIQDAKRHGVMIEPVDVHESLWDTTCLDHQSACPRIRLGFNQIKGLSEKTAERLLSARIQKAFVSLNDLTQRAGLHRDEVRLLTQSGALSGLIKDRRHAHWQALASHVQGDLLAHAPIRETTARLKQTPNSQLLVEDYATLGYSLSQHPIEYLRPHGSHILKRSDQLPSLPNPSHQVVEVMGLVTHRQRPGTASGVVFLSLEDEAGLINVIVWPKIAMRDQVALLQGQILRVCGQLQQRDGSTHIIAQSIVAEDQRLAQLLGHRH